MRKTKIVCTLGPSTDSDAVLKQMIQSGMDVARFNFSHSTHMDHLKRFKTLVKMREECNRPIATMLDTKGPEIRVGFFRDGSVQLERGQHFTLTTLECEGTDERVTISYRDLPRDIGVGTTILIDDGLIELEAEKITETDIVCLVKNGGTVSNRKGVNVPNVKLSMPYISEQDRKDIVFGIQTGFDFIAASFVRSAEDVLLIRKILEEYQCDTINIIAKIENAEGVENIDEIIEVSDGIMVARGDMGVEIPNEDVPVIQKMIIKKVYHAGKQVITATQMLDSMMKNPRPTRAETADVANAIYDGTSAVMLSGETAAGLYPVEAVRTMARIAVRTEQDIDYRKRFRIIESNGVIDVTTAISHATCTTAHDIHAAAIITVTKSGRTARMISRFRPDCPVMGCSMYSHVCRQLNLSWGVTPILLQEEKDTFVLFDHAIDEVRRAGYVKNGDLTVITAGVPLGRPGTTNIIKVQTVGTTNQ